MTPSQPPAPPIATEVLAATAALSAVALGTLCLTLFPSLELAVFARGAAELAGLFTGAPVISRADGWLLPNAILPVAVTAKCSATDLFLMVAALVSWQLTRRRVHPARALLTGLFAAAPLAIFLNALRVVTLIAAHRWLIPLLPGAYGPFLHMLTGAAIFLPALILLNLLLDSHGRSHFALRA